MRRASPHAGAQSPSGLRVEHSAALRERSKTGVLCANCHMSSIPDAARADKRSRYSSIATGAEYRHASAAARGGSSSVPRDGVHSGKVACVCCDRASARVSRLAGQLRSVLSSRHVARQRHRKSSASAETKPRPSQPGHCPSSLTPSSTFPSSSTAGNNTVPVPSQSSHTAQNSSGSSPLCDVGAPPREAS
jgi:hypothetical protein